MNRYGHPSKEVIKRLKSNGTKIFITMDQGAFHNTTDGVKITKVESKVRSMINSVN